MPHRGDAVARPDRRWWRPDAARWVWADVARFLKPGVDPRDVFPALAQKAFNPNQPRVPKGDPDGGQWTSGSAGEEGDVAQPMGSIDFGDISDELRLLRPFGITPYEREGDGVQLAGDPPLPDAPEPPEIPSRMPEAREERMSFVRRAARFLRSVGRYSPLADIFFGAADQVDEIRGLVDVIRTANDPPRELEDLRDRRFLPSESGYQNHHIVGQHSQNRERFGDELIDSRDNVVRIPTLRHIDISSWYSTQNDEFGRMSPRDLRDKDFEEQMRAGLKLLRDRGVIK